MRPIRPGKGEQDKLEQHFREQLRNMEVTPPPAMWDKIDGGLDNERQKIRYDHWYYVLLVLLLPLTATNLVANYGIKDYYKAFFTEKHREDSYGPRYNLVGAYPSQIRHLDRINQRTITQPLDMNYVDDVASDEPVLLAALAKNTLPPFIANNNRTSEIIIADNSSYIKAYEVSVIGYNKLAKHDAMPSLAEAGFGYVPDRIELTPTEASPVDNDHEIKMPIHTKRFTKFESKKNSPLSLPKIKGFYFGGDVGSNQTQLILRKSAFYPLISKDATFGMKWGLSYGVKAGYNFTRHFGVEAGCTINSAQGVTYVDNANGKLPINGEINLTYLHVPVVAKYKFSRVSKLTGQPVSLNVIGGIMYSHLKEANMKINESRLSDVKNLFAANELGVIVGIEYDVYLTPNIFFNVGGKGSVSTDVKVLQAAQAKATSYNIMLGLNAGINFQMPNKKRDQVKTVPVQPY